MFPRRKCLYFYFSPMKKIILGVVCALALPLLSVSADTTTTVTGTGTTQSGVVRPPMGTGAMMERELKGLHLAIGQLSPADREALVKMIKDYLVSKGIDPAKYAEKREEIKDAKKEMKDKIKDMRKEGREKMKDMRKATREEIQKKRDEMQAKIKEMRGNGKVNVQDMH